VKKSRTQKIIRKIKKKLSVESVKLVLAQFDTSRYEQLTFFNRVDYRDYLMEQFSI
jgi:hypothetical protein